MHFLFFIQEVRVLAQLKDSIVQGSLRATDSLLTTTLQTKILNVPTSNGGTTYGAGTSGHILFSGGSTNGAYWGATTGITSVGTITAGTWNSTIIGFTSGEVLIGNGANAVGTRAIVNNTSTGALGWTGSATTATNLYLINRNTLAYWNGAYSGTSSNLTVLGTVTTGVWNATKINPNKGGTGIDTYAQGDILYAGSDIANTATTALSKLTIGAASTFLISNGTAPTWGNTIGNLTIGGAVDTDAGKRIVSSSTLYLATSKSSSVVFYTNGTERGRFDTSGHFRPGASLTYKLGTSDYYWDGAYIGGNGNIHWNNLCRINTKIVAGETTRGLPRIMADNSTNIEGHGNVFFGMPAQAVTYEYTTNNGSTWTVGSKTNDEKRNFTNGAWSLNVFNVGNVANAASDATCTTAVGYGARVTLDLQVENRTGWCNCLIVRWITRGMTCKLLVERWNKNTNTWIVMDDVTTSTDQYRVIYPETNIELYGNGNSSSYTARRFNKIRITLLETAVGTANRYPPSIGGIAGYGDGYIGTTINSTYKYGRLFDRITGQQGMPLYISDRVTGALRAPVQNFWISGTGAFKNANTESDQEGRNGLAYLTIGNSDNINAANVHSEGRIYIYSAATKGHVIRGTSTTTDYHHYFPNSTGWIATGGDGTSTGVAGADQIMYLSTAGVLTAGTSATEYNQVNTIVKRNASGNFDANVVSLGYLSMRPQNDTYDGGEICLQAAPNHSGYDCILDVYDRYFRIVSVGMNHALFHVDLLDGTTYVSKGCLSIGEYTANTSQSKEYNVYVHGGAGSLGMFSQAANTGARGIWGWNSAGTSGTVFLTDQDNRTTFYGRLYTHNEAGFTMDDFGNLTHRRSTNTDYLHLDNNAGSATLMYYWETGRLALTGSLQLCSSGYGIDWKAPTNIHCTCTANSQEWSIDLDAGDYTGTYFHIWSTKNSASILSCMTDTRYVNIPVHLYVGEYNNTSYGLSASSIACNGNLLVSASNATGGGIILSDDGDIVDLNDGYCSMRFTYGVRVYSANKGGSAVVKLGADGTVWASSYLHSATHVCLSAGNIRFLYSNDWYDVVLNYANGNTGLNACGGGVYLGYSTTNGIYFHTNGGQRGYVDNSGVHGAVWNDFAEYRKSTCKEPGRVVVDDGHGCLHLCNERLAAGARIISDTYGMSVGYSLEQDTPIGVGGRVLVYPTQPIENYHVGDSVCTGPNGTADIMTRAEIINYPDRIIGTVSEIPTYKIWTQQATEEDEPIRHEVKGRIWVYVK